MGILSPASAGEAVTYRLTFISYWSSTSHPIDFPSDAHFSGLIGGTHHDGFVMWEPGELASPGIQRMAETGSKSPLDEEVMAAIDAGLADVLISGGSMPVSPGEVTVAFEIQESHPLVSVVTMVAPSPDWFVGVNGVSLRGAEGWIPNLTVDLLVWDSGTDSGETFTAPNEVTDPPVPIFEKDDYAFASGALIGQFVFSLVTVDVPEEAPAASRINLAPNPFRSELHVTVPGDQRATVDIFDASGRRVRRLVGAPGQRTIRWNALYEDGVQASAGVYWLRIRSGAGVETIRAVLAR
jgi:hypothetical protein